MKIYHCNSEHIIASNLSFHWGSMAWQHAQFQVLLLCVQNKVVAIAAILPRWVLTGTLHLVHTSFWIDFGCCTFRNLVLSPNFAWLTRSVSQSQMWPQLKIYQIPQKHKVGVQTGLMTNIHTEDCSLSPLNQVSKGLNRTISEKQFSKILLWKVMDYILSVK